MYRQEVTQVINWKTDKIANTEETIKRFFCGWNYKTYTNVTTNTDWEAIDNKTTGEIKGFTGGY